MGGVLWGHGGEGNREEKRTGRREGKESRMRGAVREMGKEGGRCGWEVECKRKEEG